MTRTQGYRLIQACFLPEREEFRNVGVILQGTSGAPLVRVASGTELQGISEEGGLPSAALFRAKEALGLFTNHLFASLLSRPLDAQFAELLAYGVDMKVGRFQALALPPTSESADNLYRVLVSREPARG